MNNYIKFLFLLIFSLAFQSSLIAQQNADSFNQFDEQGKKHGPWLVYLDSNLFEVFDISKAVWSAYKIYCHDKIFLNIGHSKMSDRKNKKLKIIEMPEVIPSVGLIDGTYRVNYVRKNSAKTIENILFFEKGFLKERHSINRKDGSDWSISSYEKLFHDKPFSFFVRESHRNIDKIFEGFFYIESGEWVSKIDSKEVPSKNYWDNNILE